MASYEFTGTVVKVGETQSFGSNGFTKREIVVSSEGEKYPQEIPFEFVKEKGALLDGIVSGSRVKISFDLRGREYNGRYFINANGWKIEKLDGSESAGMPDDIPPVEAEYSGEISGDMPF